MCLLSDSLSLLPARTLIAGQPSQRRRRLWPPPKAAASGSPPPPPPPPSITSDPRNGTKGDAVYVASVPLRAMKGPAQLALSTAYSLGVWDLQHFMVIVKPRHSPEAIVFDFQPNDPEDVYTAIAALSHNHVSGVVFRRKLSRIPKSRCWFVGFVYPDGIDMSDKFVENWDLHLIIGDHDCRHFTNGLVRHLTGRPNILEYLRSTFHG